MIFTIGSSSRNGNEEKKKTPNPKRGVVKHLLLTQGTLHGAAARYKVLSRSSPCSAGVPGACKELPSSRDVNRSPATG